MEQAQLTQLREDLRGYHADVKRRLDLTEDTLKEHHIAIHGIAGDDTVPGLNVEVQELRKSLDGFRERVRIGLSAAWAATLAMGSILWKGR